MYFVGIDLAWGERARTGLAVLDDTGALVHLSAATTDDTIAAALGPYLDDECLVAIDAPLIVTNPTGNRPCEAALNRDFARFEAGAHPSNTGRPELHDTPRGARLAARFALDIDPDSVRTRRAIEVYPHPALVALFRLGRTLKYKQRQNRPFEGMREEMLRLIGLLDGLADAPLPLRLADSAPWHEVTEAVRAATHKSELRTAEDRIDAVVCAYVALYAVRRPAGTTVYGDGRTGYIVTPTLPADLVPEPPAHPPVATDPELTRLVRGAARRYAELQPYAEEAAQRLTRWLTGTLDDAGINYLDITGRGKGIASFAAKANKAVDGHPVYPDPLRDITDQIGARIITYVRSDVAVVADLLADHLTVLDDRDMGQLTASEGRFGYVSRHLQIALDPLWLGDLPVDMFPAPSAQVQIRTVLQHAWAEFEHDIRYKGSVPEELAPDLNRRFTLAAGLLELADREFEVIRERLRERTPPRDLEADPYDPRISAEELATFLAGQFPDSGWSRTDHYTWISGLLLELGVDSLHKLAGLLGSVDSAAITDRMGYKHPPGAVRRLDDALLALFGTSYIRLKGNGHRVELLTARLDRLQSGDGPTQ
ncbi:DUF429 domain-containing protein [Raineyella sp. LH-20]|uniref:DUF429 domain-containing protein n=1 Tax=Raineyella sp. LH-20 TaxID=3081204 RepID=UPI0029552B98|nr:DUF429 domain-containing protein [Raineyella sp. LH-20]WOP18783.1 DUF429 domain-containing protein [Raineyella sp. LH-20]